MEDTCPHSLLHFCVSNDHIANDSLDAGVVELPKNVDAALFVLTCIFVSLGLVANFLVVLVVARKKDMRTVCNILVANLAVRDIVFLCVVGLTDIAFHALHLVQENDTQTQAISSLTVYGLTVTIMATSGFLVALALDRYRSIGQPMTSRTKKSIKSAMISSAVIWIVSLLLCIVHPVLKTQLRQIAWLHTIVVLAFIAYVVPLTVVLGCYVAIYVAVRRQESGEWNHLTRWDFRRKIRVLRMVAYVVIVFLLAWGFWYAICIYIAVKLTKGVDLTQQDQILVGVADLLVFAAGAVNPFIYGITNANFNRHFKALLCRSFTPRSLQHISASREPNVETNTDTIRVPSDKNVHRHSMITIETVD